MKNILCIGGSGQLGSKVISLFKNHKVVNVDFKQHPTAQNNILLKPTNQTQQNNQLAIDSVKALGLKYHAILVTAGGWTGGSIKQDNYYSQVKLMSEVCLYPSLLAAHLATKYLNPGGLITFTGAAAIYKEPNADMIGYALAKNGVHYLASALAQKAHTFEGKVVTILPEIIDTPMNREAMPKADFNTWSKPEQIGQLLLSWVEGLNVPANGSFLLLKVKNGCLQPEFV